MRYKNIYLLIFPLLAFCACQKEELTEYNQSLRYLYIPTVKEANLKSFSFQHHLGEVDYEIQFPVKLAGQKLSEDKTFVLEVVEGEEFTTALPGDYTLPREQVFHAGVFEDVIKLTLHKTDNLKNDREVTLTMRLVPNETFALGEYMGDSGGIATTTKESITATITFNDKISQPDWWNDRITKLFLGVYSDNKYSYFIMSTGVSDLTGLDFTKIRELALHFKNDLPNHPDWKEANGEPIIVVVN